jgi:hypothetical protein
MPTCNVFRNTVSRDFQRSPIEGKTGSIGRRTLGSGLLPNANHDPTSGRYDVPNQLRHNFVRVLDECRVCLFARGACNLNAAAQKWQSKR